MPLLKQIWFGSDTALQLWTLTEDSDSLSKLVTLHNIELQLFNRISNETRKAEFLVARILLRNVFPDSHIEYSIQGAPVIVPSDVHVSISHTTGMVCLLHSIYPCGIDVEQIGTRALRLTKRFVSHSEASLIGEEFPARDATLIWSVKETLYKLLRKEGVDFATQLIIDKVDDDKKIYTSIITENKKTTHCVNYTIFDNYVLTWVVDEKKLSYEHF